MAVPNTSFTRGGVVQKSMQMRVAVGAAFLDARNWAGVAAGYTILLDNLRGGAGAAGSAFLAMYASSRAWPFVAPDLGARLGRRAGA